MDGYAVLSVHLFATYHFLNIYSLPFMHRVLIMSVSVTAEFFVTPDLYVTPFKLNKINLYPLEQDFSLIETFEAV